VELRHGLDEDRWIEVDSAIGGNEFDLPSAMRDTVDLLEGVADARVDAPRSPRMISVHGVDLSFAFASAGDRWIAIGAAGNV